MSDNFLTVTNHILDYVAGWIAVDCNYLLVKDCPNSVHTILSIFVSLILTKTNPLQKYSIWYDIAKNAAAYLQVNFRPALPVTHYPLRPESVGFLAYLIDGWSDLHVGNAAAH